MSLNTQFIETVHQPIIIRNSKWKLLLMAVVSLAFVLIGVWMVRSDQGPKAYYGGWASIIFFGLCLLVFLFLMFTSSPLLSVDDEGIHSYYPLWRPCTIRWEEISSIYPITIRYTSIFTVDVSPVGKQCYIARNFKAGKIPFNMRKADTPSKAISISLAAATLSTTKAIAQIQERYAAQIAQYRIYIQEK